MFSSPKIYPTNCLPTGMPNPGLIIHPTEYSEYSSNTESTVQIGKPKENIPIAPNSVNNDKDIISVGNNIPDNPFRNDRRVGSINDF
jgi:hypothetical protein